MINSKHINDSLDRIRVLFEAASEIVEAIKPGETLPATTLAKQIAELHGMTGPAFYPTMKFLTDTYPGIIVKRGAKGGLFRPLPATVSTPVVPVNDDETK